MAPFFSLTQQRGSVQTDRGLFKQSSLCIGSTDLTASQTTMFPMKGRWGTITSPSPNCTVAFLKLALYSQLTIRQRSKIMCCKL